MALSRAFGFSKPRPPSMDMIERNLYLCGIDEVTDIEVLKQHEITHILTINDIPLPGFVKRACPYMKMKFIMAEDAPHSDLLSYFDETYEFIKDGLSRGAVVVHCVMGVSRSATIVIAYLMKKYKLSYRKASAMVRSKRPVCPNTGFVKQLENYEQLGYNTLYRFSRRY
nr:dual specificity protein phosphatase MPK-4-like [Leptinotarsa decemlineata]